MSKQTARQIIHGAEIAFSALVGSFTGETKEALRTTPQLKGTDKNVSEEFEPFQANESEPPEVQRLREHIYQLKNLMRFVFNGLETAIATENWHVADRLEQALEKDGFPPQRETVLVWEVYNHLYLQLPDKKSADDLYSRLDKFVTSVAVWETNPIDFRRQYFFFLHQLNDETKQKALASIQKWGYRISNQTGKNPEQRRRKSFEIKPDDLVKLNGSEGWFEDDDQKIWSVEIDDNYDSGLRNTFLLMAREGKSVHRQFNEEQTSLLKGFKWNG